MQNELQTLERYETRYIFYMSIDNNYTTPFDYEAADEAVLDGADVWVACAKEIYKNGKLITKDQVILNEEWVYYNPFSGTTDYIDICKSKKS